MNRYTLFYVHDPMCAWCYGYKKSLHVITQSLPEHVVLVKVLGGLAADTDEPMPQHIRDYVKDNWKRIEAAIPGVTFNFDFWDKCMPRRATYPSCRAVIAAKYLDPLAEDKMIEAIQRAYYQEARNPSDVDTLLALASEIGLNSENFEVALHSKNTDDVLRQKIQQSRQMPINGFPSLVLESKGAFASIPVDYNKPSTTHQLITSITQADEVL